MADPGKIESGRISHIDLDEATILWRNPDIEQERRIAIFDLIEENTFRPLRSADWAVSEVISAASGRFFQ